MTPRIGSLCSGYGGLDLGLMSVVGGSVAWHVEYDKHPSAVLDARFPGVPNYGDVKHTDWTAVEPVDWLTAGYPCQPFSGAGLRKGEDDPRHLWPDVCTAVRVLRPRRVLLENVAGHLSLGFGSVLGDLAALGYDCRWVCLRAADVGAPHRRERVFIVATDARSARARWDGAGAPRPEEQDRRSEPGHTDTPRFHHRATAHASGERHGRRQDGRSLGRMDRADAGEARERERAWPVTGDRSAAAPADADCGRRVQPDARLGRVSEPHQDTDAAADPEHAERPRERDGAGPSSGPDSGDQTWGVYAAAINRWAAVMGRPAPTPTVDGRLNQRFVEWMMGLPAGHVTDILPRNPALKALGNGVVPQQAALAITVLMQRAEAVA